MNEYVSELVSISKKFKSLTDNDDAVVTALNELSLDNLVEIKKYLDSTSAEKINKIRLNVVEYLIENRSITLNEIENIKETVNLLYPKNILNSWRTYFKLFYTFFYLEFKDDVKRKLNELSKTLAVDLNLSKFVSIKINDFNGPSSYGSDQSWLALYNNKQPNHSFSLQLFMNLSYPEITYGLFEYNNPNKFLNHQVVASNEFNYEEMVRFLRQSREKIINDSKPITVWQFSPGADAVYWDQMYSMGIASIGWGNYNFCGLKKSQIKKLNPIYFTDHDRDVSIISLFENAKEGDLIYAFKGREIIIGHGVINGLAKYNNDPLIPGTDHHNYLSVNWSSDSLREVILKKKFSEDVFADISNRRKEIEDQVEKPPLLNDSIGVSEDESDYVSLPVNQILYGPPGTGKTYNTIDYALKIIKKYSYKKYDREYNLAMFKKYRDAKQIVFTTFHQSYSYEDFVEGIKVEKDENTNQLTYDVKPGVFKALCEKAESDQSSNYVIIIDEINRGNISKILGELITLIEPDKRKGAKEELSVTLPYSKKYFSVPRNVNIIGTMNTADVSIAKLDVALRRRFDFIEMPPKPGLLTHDKTLKGRPVIVDSVNLKDMLTAINQRIELLYDREHTLGHSFFMKLTNDSSIEELAEIFKKNIIPLLQEYFFDDWARIHTVLDCLKCHSDQATHFVKRKYGHSSGELIDLMGKAWVKENDNNNNNFNAVWGLNENTTFEKPDSYRLIYANTENALALNKESS